MTIDKKCSSFYVNFPKSKLKVIINCMSKIHMLRFNTIHDNPIIPVYRGQLLEEECKYDRQCFEHDLTKMCEVTLVLNKCPDIIFLLGVSGRRYLINATNCIYE